MVLFYIIKYVKILDIYIYKLLGYKCKLQKRNFRFCFEKYENLKFRINNYDATNNYAD